MIIITGAVRVRPDAWDEAVRLSVEHSTRSRAEPGCLRHDAHADLDAEHRIVFLEYWADRSAVDTHFAVPESGEFVSAISALATEPPTMELHQVTDA